MSYQHLTLEERYCLAEFREKGLGIRAIARMLQRSPSTIQPGVEKKSREEGLSSLWGVQQGEAPKADAAQTAKGV